MKAKTQKTTLAKVKRKAFNFSLPASVVAELDAEAKESGLPKSIIVQLALQAHFESAKKKNAKIGEAA